MSVRSLGRRGPAGDLSRIVVDTPAQVAKHGTQMPTRPVIVIVSQGGAGVTEGGTTPHVGMGGTQVEKLLGKLAYECPGRAVGTGVQAALGSVVIVCRCSWILSEESGRREKSLRVLAGLGYTFSN